MRKFWAGHLDDVLIVGGGALITAGVSILSIAGGLITAGALMVCLGVLIGLGNRGGDA